MKTKPERLNSTKKNWIWFCAVILLTILIIFVVVRLKPVDQQRPVSSIPPELNYLTGYRVINQYHHDPQAFTQGLIFHEGYLYESTGLRGYSSLRKVDLESGEIVQMTELDDPFFAEGLTLWNKTLVQLTWQEQIGFRYNLEDFTLIDTFSYNTEGWGLTHDGSNLIMSDGTSALFFLDPNSLKVVRTVEVSDHGTPVTRINELEYVLGEVYANIWQSDTIARIDPSTGLVNGWIDLEGLLPVDVNPDTVDVLNGIAYDPTQDRLFLTGKLWPYLFEIALLDPLTTH
jgi:glutamine cyclotransferase